jgi:hypothetical protein
MIDQNKRELQSSVPMDHASKDLRLSHMMRHIVQLCSRESLTLGELLHELSVFGHMLVCLVFAVPFLLPIPLPGLSTFFGLVIGFVALQIAFKQDPWVPVSWRVRAISPGILLKLFSGLTRILTFTERFIRPRFKFFARHPGFVRVNGLVMFVLAALLALPMPPGFNAPPALAIIVLAVGSLERDGAVVCLGYALTALNFVFFSAFFTLGYDGLQLLLQKTVPS